MHARYARAIITGAAFSLPVLFCIWLAAYMYERAVVDALSKGQGVLCVGLDIYFYFLLLVTGIFALAGIVSVAYAGKLVSRPGEAGKTGGAAGAAAVIASVLVILAGEAFIQLVVDRNFMMPDSPMMIVYLALALFLYCTVPVIFAASISAFSGLIYYRYRRRREVKI